MLPRGGDIGGDIIIKNTSNALRNLASGTALLTLSALITKIIGLFYKIPLIKYVGIEGMAYFLAANHIYVFLFVVSTAGLPVAVSILISESMANNDEERIAYIYRTALRIFISIGLVGSVVMLIAAEKIAEAINICGSSRSIMAISPAVLAACICGAVRGYFQGRQIMLHTAVSQIIEAVGKLVLGLLGAIYAVSRGYESPDVAAYAILGITFGMIVSMIYLLISKARYDKKHTCSENISRIQYSGTAKQLFVTALPITFSSAVISLTSVTDTALVANRLEVAGLSENIINTLYSCYGNIAVPLFSLTPSLISPIAMSAVPIIASSIKNRDSGETMRKVILSSLELTLFIAIPASIGLSVFSREIISLIFPGDSVTLNTAVPLLSLLSPAVVCACLITITNAILQACGKAGKTIISMMTGALVKAIFEYILVSQPSVNIFGAPLSTLMCNIVVVCLNILFLSENVLRIRDMIAPFIKISISALTAVVAVALIRNILLNYFDGMIVTLILITLVALIYMVLCVFTKALGGELQNILTQKILKNKDLLKNEQRRKSEISVER